MAIFLAFGKVFPRTKKLAPQIHADILLVKTRTINPVGWAGILIYLLKRKPRSVIVQTPPCLAVTLCLLLRPILRFKVVADVHTGTFLHQDIKMKIFERLFSWSLRFADIVIAHNKPLLNKFLRSVKRKLLLPDPPPKISKNYYNQTLKMKKDHLFFVLPASFNYDEPIEVVIKAFSYFPSFKLYITGDWSKRPEIKELIVKLKAKNVVLTGYLPQREYYKLLASSDILIGITTREYTYLSVISEAVAFRKPLLLSKTETLQSLIRRGAIFFQLNVGGLREVLEYIEKNPKIILELKREFEIFAKNYEKYVARLLGILRKLVS